MKLFGYGLIYCNKIKGWKLLKFKEVDFRCSECIKEWKEFCSYIDDRTKMICQKSLCKRIV